jgi:8-oxo-dGTP pyrophosphatase MutT (NUDIX family)
MNNLSLTPAATVLLVRDCGDELEVLMVKRSKRPPFGNLYVFPGGKIDESDKDLNITNFCNGLNDEQASIKLGVNEGGLSYWVACVRECFEEVGILLAIKNNGEELDLNGADKHKFDNYRRMLLENKISLFEICKKENLSLNLNNIEPFSHWITPEIEIKRFDTRFFIAYIPAKQTERHDGNELTDSVWISPKKALDRSLNGEMPMIMPTISNLQQCLEFDSGQKLLEHQSKLTNDDIPSILPKFFKNEGKWVGLLPGDEDYDNY